MLLPPHPDQDSYDWWLWTESAKLRAKIIGPPRYPLRVTKPILMNHVRQGKVQKHSQLPAWYPASKASAIKSLYMRHQAKPTRRQRRSSRKQSKKTHRSSSTVSTAFSQCKSVHSKRRVISLAEKHAIKLRKEALAEKEFSEALGSLVDLFTDFNFRTAAQAEKDQTNSIPASSTIPPKAEAAATSSTQASHTAPLVDPDTPDEMDSERDPLAIAKEWSDNLAEDAKNIREREDGQIEREWDFEARMNALRERERALREREASKVKKPRVTIDLTDDDHVQIKTEPEAPEERVIIDLTETIADHGTVPSKPKAAPEVQAVPVEAQASPSTTKSTAGATEIPQATVKTEPVIKHELSPNGEVVSTTTTTTATTTVSTTTIRQNVVPSKRKRDF